MNKKEAKELEKELEKAAEDVEVGSPDECQGIDEAIKRFEKIMMSRIYLQQRLGDRLKVSIRTGMVVMFFIAVSLFVLLMTLSIQVSRVADVADNMNKNFRLIAKNMVTIHQFMDSMEKQIAYMPKIKSTTGFLAQHMEKIGMSLEGIDHEVATMNNQLNQVQSKMSNISSSVQLMDSAVGNMDGEVRRMAKPANAVNKFLPF